MNTEPSRTVFLHPRYWPTWMGIGVVRLLAVLPLPLLRALGTALGGLTYALYASRRRIARINIGLCRPELSPLEQERLARRHFRELGCSILTTGISWFAPAKRLDRLFQVVGREHLDAVIARGDNVILLAPHVVALEIGGFYISRLYPAITIFQSIKNPVVERVLRRRRSRFGGVAVQRKAPLHQLLRWVRAGRLFYYLPDQDPGPRKGVFVPFFGVEAATFPMLSRFARLSQARVLPFLTEQLEGGRGWRIHIMPPIEDFPTEDAVADTALMNRVIEKTIALAPAQYFWVHKRFKTRPEGARPVY